MRALFAAAALFLGVATAAQAATLDEVKARGSVNCGVNPNLQGFGAKGADGQPDASGAQQQPGGSSDGADGSEGEQGQDVQGGHGWDRGVATDSPRLPPRAAGGLAPGRSERPHHRFVLTEGDGGAAQAAIGVANLQLGGDNCRGGRAGGIKAITLAQVQHLIITEKFIGQLLR